MLSSKIEDFFDFTTFFTTFGSKDMPNYAVKCHQAKMADPLKCSRFQSENGISWYKFAQIGVFKDDKSTIRMPRHHFNQLRFAQGINDKSRFVLKLHQFCNIFEFRYEFTTTKNSPERGKNRLFQDCFLFVCHFVQNVFFRQTNTF